MISEINPVSLLMFQLDCVSVLLPFCSRQLRLWKLSCVSVGRSDTNRKLLYGQGTLERKLIASLLQIHSLFPHWIMCIIVEPSGSKIIHRFLNNSVNLLLRKCFKDCRWNSYKRGNLGIFNWRIHVHLICTRKDTYFPSINNLCLRSNNWFIKYCKRLGAFI